LTSAHRPFNNPSIFLQNFIQVASNASLIELIEAISSSILAHFAFEAVIDVSETKQMAPI
jgi:hypothetical protein